MKILQKWIIFLIYWLSARILIGITFICLLRTCAHARVCMCVCGNHFPDCFFVYLLYEQRSASYYLPFILCAITIRCLVFDKARHSRDSNQIAILSTLGKVFPLLSSSLLFSCSWWQLLFTFASTKKGGRRG